MRFAVLSDIHSNLEALEAVLERAGTERADATLVLGDIVGYGADPVGVVERLAGSPATTMIAGNHDLAATERFDPSWFNDAAETAIRWTTGVLTDAARARLDALEPRGDTERFVLVHGSVVDPAAEYVFNETHAGSSFDAEPFSICLFGHTHRPTAFIRDDSGVTRGTVLADGEALEVRGGRFMLNPGSVGQPRDGDPRASFMIYDDEAATAVVHRVAYDMGATQRKIVDAGLPIFLAERLAVGR